MVDVSLLFLSAFEVKAMLKSGWNLDVAEAHFKYAGRCPAREVSG